MSTPHTERPARFVAILALSTALVFALQVALAAVPNGELVTLLMLLYTKYYRRRTLYVIYVFALLEGLFYGFGLWWVMYLYVWTILWAIAAPMCRKERPVWHWAVLASAFGFCYGFLCALPHLAVGGVKMAFSWWVAGIPFDLAHGVFNFVLVYLLYPPFDRFFARMEKNKMLL